MEHFERSIDPILYAYYELLGDEMPRFIRMGNRCFFAYKSLRDDRFMQLHDNNQFTINFHYGPFTIERDWSLPDDQWEIGHDHRWELRRIK